VAIIYFTETISEQKERSRTTRCFTINLMPELIFLVDTVKDTDKSEACSAETVSSVLLNDVQNSSDKNI